MNKFKKEILIFALFINNIEYGMEPYNFVFYENPVSTTKLSNKIFIFKNSYIYVNVQ